MKRLTRYCRVCMMLNLLTDLSWKWGLNNTTEVTDLSGEIPSEIGELTTLTYLYLRKYLISQGSDRAVEAFYSCLMD